jgi:hypothetical protein
MIFVAMDGSPVETYDWFEPTTGIEAPNDEPAPAAAASHAMTTPENRRSWHFRQLKWSLQALAQAGSPQRSLFPERTPSPSDLAFGFDHWRNVVCDLYEADLTGEQSAALEAIAAKLRTLSRDGAEFDVDLWTERALTASEHWTDVREMALGALDAFGWGASYLRDGDTAGVETAR